MSQDTDYQGRRSSERKKVLLKAKLVIARESYDCDILNISTGGAKIQCAQKIESGTKVVLNLDPFGEFSSEVVWQRGDEAGIRFEQGSENIAEVVLGIAIYG